MASKTKANERRELASNPAVSPEMRDYLDQLNTKVTWGTTTTSTTTTTTTTTS